MDTGRAAGGPAHRAATRVDFPDPAGPTTSTTRGRSEFPEGDPAGTSEPLPDRRLDIQHHLGLRPIGI